MQQWYNVEGERHLLEAESVDESGDRLEQILNSFTGFLIEANVRPSLILLILICAHFLIRLIMFFSILRIVDIMPCH